MSQTTVQNPNTIRFGSGVLEIGEDENSLVNIGALNSLHFTHDVGDKIQIESDNAGIVLERFGTQTVTVAADLLEINLENLAMYLSGTGVYTDSNGVKRLSVGGIQTLTANMARITNYDSNHEVSLVITVYKATANTGIEIEFQADSADEANVVPIELGGTEDTTRDAGDQLFVIEDYAVYETDTSKTSATPTNLSAKTTTKKSDK